MSTPAMFRTGRRGGDELLLPTPAAASQWAGSSTMRGLASSAVMARAVERAVGADSPFRPVRWTADLSRPIPMEPTTVAVDVVREGRRLRLVDVELQQDGVAMARARALFLTGRAVPEDSSWSPQRTLAEPPVDLRPDTPEPRLYFSQEVGWSARAADHHNTSRKQVWTFPFTLVEGEAPTPFQLAAGYADLASLTSNWGTEGVAWINADLTLAMARLPADLQLGIAGTDRTASDGVSVGTALMHDRQGVFGTVTVCAVWNGDRVVDPAKRDRPATG